MPESCEDELEREGAKDWFCYLVLFPFYLAWQLDFFWEDIGNRRKKRRKQISTSLEKATAKIVYSTGWVRCSEFTTLYDKPKHCNRYKRIEPQNEYHSNCKKDYMKRPRAAVEIPAPPDEWSDDMKRLYKSVIDSLTGDSEWGQTDWRFGGCNSGLDKA